MDYAETMKTLVTYGDPMEAQLLRARLEGSGIVAHVFDENTATLASYAIGGVRVEVADEDYERAMELLLDDSPTKAGY
jgi:hypothetical protein